YPRLKIHFQFINELKLFAEVDHHVVYSLNVYSNIKTNKFITIANLFQPLTIDQCFNSSISGPVPGIKNENNEWNVKGHPERVVHVGRTELAIFARLFDGTENADEARLPALHAQQLVNVLAAFLKQEKTIANLGDKVYTSQMWNETNSQKNGTIRRETRFPDETSEFVYSGPHIGVANPLFKTPKAICRLNSDYDNLDLQSIVAVPSYIQRTNYTPTLEKTHYVRCTPNAPWGGKYIDYYRIVMRRMLNQSGERTLVSAIVPPKTAHIDTVFGIILNESKYLALFSALVSSIPFDFIIKTTGKSDVRYDLVSKLPIPQSPGNDALILRTLQLNCLTSHYAKLWEECWQEQFRQEDWAKVDDRLNREKFSALTRDWTSSTPLRTDFERRQALVEIDVLTAMALDMTLPQLKTIYRIQFPVLQSYEADTWYDRNGRIVFTNNRGLTGVGYTRPEWEQVKNAPSGTITRILTDDTMPGGPVERTIEYVAPFDRCDREQDYEIAWRHFEHRFGKAGEGDKA
ncbi:MAG: hypothetical protein WA151_00310, partial [Desulfatirhabdiaceae bacterium]